jgi:hypothetical protein
LVAVVLAGMEVVAVMVVITAELVEQGEVGRMVHLEEVLVDQMELQAAAELWHVPLLDKLERFMNILEREVGEV